jgi:hypothetical protein
MRALIAATALCLIAAPALAADPKVEAAIKAFKAVGADAEKLKTYCEMSKLMEQMGEKEDKALEAKIDSELEKLGADFATAWETAGTVDENSADGKALSAALDEVSGKCPQ